nr:MULTISPECIES: hypothetical protein [unclassified Frankia]
MAVTSGDQRPLPDANQTVGEYNHAPDLERIGELVEVGQQEAQLFRGTSSPVTTEQDD